MLRRGILLETFEHDMTTYPHLMVYDQKRVLAPGQQQTLLHENPHSWPE